MRRGRGEEAGESLGRAKSSASWGGGGGAAGLQMTRSQAVVAGEHAVVAGHVEAGRRDQGEARRRAGPGSRTWFSTKVFLSGS